MSQNNLFLKKIAKSLSLLIVSVLSIALIVSVAAGYEASINFIGRYIDGTSIRNIFDHNRFIVVQVLSAILLVLSYYLILKKFDAIFHAAGQFFRDTLAALKNIGKDLCTKNALIVLTIPLFASIYFALTIPVSYDEVWTYLDFTRKPFYHCMMYYPYPNNHILHSLLTNVTEHLPFFSMLFKIRIPAILASFFAWVVAYSFLKKYYSVKVAVFVVGIASVMFRSIYYSSLSRGYALVVLFFIISLYAAYNIIYKGSRRKDWIFFALSNTLGCYTMPSFLYPIVMLNLLILIYNYKNIVQQIKYNIASGVLTFVLYTPVFLVSGIKALTNNQFVSPENHTRLDVLKQLPLFGYETIADLTGMSGLKMAIILAVVLIIAIKNKDKSAITLWLVFGITPALLLLVHSVIPFYRTFIYYTFIIAFLTGISVRDELNKINIKILAVFVLILQIGSVVYFKQNIAEAETFNTYANDVTKRILKKNTTYLVNYPHIMFDMATKDGYELGNVTCQEGEVSWNNADTIGNFDYVVIYKSYDKTQIKKPVYSNQELNVYLNKQQN
ncbi:MAG: hypothetical protein ACLVKO_07035 [Dysgonomonas sp.]